MEINSDGGDEGNPYVISPKPLFFTSKEFGVVVFLGKLFYFRIVIKTFNNNTSFHYCEKITTTRSPRLCGAPHFHPKAFYKSIIYIFEHDNSFLSDRKKKKVLYFFPLSSYWDRLSPSENLLWFASRKPAAGTKDLGVFTCDFAVPHCNACEPLSEAQLPPQHAGRPPAPQLCKGFISVNNDFCFGQLKKWKFKERRRRRRKVTQMHLKHEKNYLYDKNIFRFSKHKTE